MRSRMCLQRQRVRCLWCSQSKDQTLSSFRDNDTGRLASLFPRGSESYKPTWNITYSSLKVLVCIIQVIKSVLFLQMNWQTHRTFSDSGGIQYVQYTCIHLLQSNSGFSEHLRVPLGQRWSVNSSAWRWRHLCVLCWRRWHQTFWPAGQDFAPEDRYLTPPSTCQPEKNAKTNKPTNRIHSLFSMCYIKSSFLTLKRRLFILSAFY